MRKYIDINEYTLKNLTTEEKEDLGLLILMQQVTIDDTVSEDEFIKTLNEK